MRMLKKEISIYCKLYSPVQNSSFDQGHSAILEKFSSRTPEYKVINPSATKYLLSVGSPTEGKYGSNGRWLL